MDANFIIDQLAKASDQSGRQHTQGAEQHSRLCSWVSQAQIKRNGKRIVSALAAGAQYNLYY
jgi:hypothetical protein